VPTYSACAFPRETSELVYFLAMLGTALVVMGIQQAGIGKRRIRAEGGALIIAVGVVFSTLGFLFANLLPLVSITSAEFGFSLAAIGTALFSFGLVKLSGGQINLSTNHSPYQPAQWHPNDTSAIIAITSIVVVSVLLIGLLSYQSGLCACGLVLPPGGTEGLSLESHTLNSSTNMTLNLRNTGTVATSLMIYYVRDQAGHQYSNTNWSGPTIVPNAVTRTTITIDGSSFVFQTGNSYTAIIITSRNNQFTFTVAT